MSLWFYVKSVHFGLKRNILSLGLVFLIWGVNDPKITDGTYKSGLIALGGSFLGTTLITIYLELLSNSRKIAHIQDILTLIAEYKKQNNSYYKEQIQSMFDQITGYVWEK